MNRIRVLKSWRAVNLVRFLTTSIYFLCITFIILANVLQVRLGAATLSICKGAIILCFIFYIGTKVLLYVYLVERAHQIRGKERTRDWVFLSGMAIITVGFGVIFGLAFFKPVYGVSMKSGTCIIGLQDLVTIPLLSYDVLVNLGVTGLFMFYTRMYVRPGHTKGVVHRALSIPLLKSPMKLDTQLALVELFVMKSMIGAVVIIIAAVANLVLLIKFHGKEQGWLCFTLCTLDCQSPLTYLITSIMLTLRK